MGIFLETRRLILKTPELSDLDDLIALRTAPECNTFKSKQNYLLHCVHRKMIGFVLLSNYRQFSNDKYGISVKCLILEVTKILSFANAVAAIKRS